MVRFRPQRELPHLSENKPTLLHLSRQQGCPGACDGRGSEPAQRHPFLPCPTTLAAGTSVVSTPNFPESHCRSFPLLPLLLGLSQRPSLAGCPTPSRPLAAGAGHPPLKTHACGRSDLPPAQRSSPPATPSASAVRPDVQTCSCLRALAPAVPAAWEAFPTNTCMAGFFSCLDVFPHTAGSLVRRTRGQPGATLPGLETLFCPLPASGHRECRFASPRLAFLVRKTWRMTIICGVTTRLK